MKIGFLSRRGRAPFFSVGALLICAILLTAFAASAGTSPPLKLAIFDFELEDLSAGASLAAGDPADSEQLKSVANEARRLVARSGRYALVDISSADAQAVKEHWLRKCDGCEAAIALKLGTEQSFIGIVTRITEWNTRCGFRSATPKPAPSSPTSRLIFAWARTIPGAAESPG
jgi:Protein of unknown function (DUF2380)